MREKILKGEEPLRTGRHIAVHHGAGGHIGRSAPIWWWQHHRRVAKSAGLTLPTETVTEIDVAARAFLAGPDDARWGALAAVMERVYRRPKGAQNAWLALAFENARQGTEGRLIAPNLRRALWCLKHRPDYFGDISPAVTMPPNGVIRAAGYNALAIARSLNRLATMTQVLLGNKIRAAIIEREAAIALAHHQPGRSGRKNWWQRLAEALDPKPEQQPPHSPPTPTPPDTANVVKESAKPSTPTPNIRPRRKDERER